MRALPLRSGTVVQRASFPRGRSAGFSLIELMVVVAIMAVLLALGASTLSAPKGAGEISQAGGMVSDLARLARQHALSKNTRTALVVAQVPEGSETRTAVSIWDGGTTNQLERWNLLPASVTAIDTSSMPPTDNPMTGLKFRNRDLSSNTIYWFYPDGRMGANVQRVPKLKVLSNSTNRTENYYELIFNPVTGTVKANRP